MAESLSEGGGTKGKRRKERENLMGDNLDAIRKAALPHLEKYLQVQKDMDSDMAGYKSDIDKIYEAAAKDIKCKASVIKGLCKEVLKNLRAEEKEQEMDETERAQRELLAAAMDGTPFADYVKTTLARPKTTH